MTAADRIEDLTTDPVLQLLAEARADVSGEFTSVGRVVDTLLDLRLLCEPSGDDVAEIDVVIASIPGRSVTANAWWLEQLHLLERRLESTVDGYAPTTTR